jgi:hypothetical protein
MSADFAVKIVDEGRSGSVTYCEGAIALALWWEFTTDGAYVWAPSPEQWDGYIGDPTARPAPRDAARRSWRASPKRRRSNARRRRARASATTGSR